MGDENGESKTKKGEGKGEPPKFEMTDEVKDQIGQMVSGAVNGAITRHLGGNKIKELLGGLVKESVDALRTEITPKDEGKGEPKGKGDEVELSPAMKARLDALEKENKKLHDLWNQQKDESAKEKATSRKTKERSALVEQLGLAGVPATLVKAAVALLHDAGMGKVKTDEAGAITMAVKTDVGEEDQPLSQAIGAWIKSEDGRAFLPPASGGGSGNTGGKTGGNSGRKTNPAEMSKSQLAEGLGRALLGPPPKA